MHSPSGGFLGYAKGAKDYWCEGSMHFFNSIENHGRTIYFHFFGSMF